MIGDDKSPPPALCLSVVGSIDNTPLDCIAFLIKAPENNGEITSALLCRGAYQPNVINLKRLLNGKQNVWKYQNGEEKSDSDGREKDI